MKNWQFGIMAIIGILGIAVSVLLLLEVKRMHVEQSDIAKVFAAMKSGISDVKSDISDIKSDVSSMESHTSSIDGDLSSIESEISSMSSEVSDINSDVSWIKTWGVAISR